MGEDEDCWTKTGRTLRAKISEVPSKMARRGLATIVRVQLTKSKERERNKATAPWPLAFSPISFTIERKNK